MNRTARVKRSLIRVRVLMRRARNGHHDAQHWVRVTMDRAVDDYLRDLPTGELDAVEVSGHAHNDRPWRSYTRVSYPEFDLVHAHDIGQFDVVICEQVVEHVRDPFAAMRTLAAVCRPGGHVIVTTPFLLAIHPAPGDYWRFTPDGLRQLASDAHLAVSTVASWGNSWCIWANRRRWIAFRPWHRALRRWSLANEEGVPQVVWMFARRPKCDATTG